MPRIKFEQLVEIYSHTTFSDDSSQGTLSVANDAILNTLRQIDSDEEASSDSGISTEADPQKISVGDTIDIQIQSPKIALGILAVDFDDLIKAPGAQIKEPPEYYVIKGGYTKGGRQQPAELKHYRNVLRFVATLANAASYMDLVRQELVFVKDGKFAIPIVFGVQDAKAASVTDIDRLVSYFSDELHSQQKLELLATSITSLTAAIRPDERFRYLLRNVSILADHVRDGYTLFVSSFSYAKVRNEIDAAKIDYISKVHKTIVDIQGQLLGIPIAAFVVAAQLKAATRCGVELWVNTAILSGAWIFLIMLILAVGNQWATLSAIDSEVSRQEKKIRKDYPKVADTFGKMFESVRTRITWHYIALGVIAVVGIGSAIFATLIYLKLTSIDPAACLAGRIQMVFPSV